MSGIAQGELGDLDRGNGLGGNMAADHEGPTRQPQASKDRGERTSASVDPAVDAGAFLQHLATTEGVTADTVAAALRNYRNDGLRAAVLAEISARWGNTGVQKVIDAEQRLNSGGSPSATAGHADTGGDRGPASSNSAATNSNALAPSSNAPAPKASAASLDPVGRGKEPDAITSADPAANHAPRSAIDRAIALSRLGVVHLAAIESTLVPAYAGAVAAMNTAAVKAIIMEIVGGVARIVDAQDQIVQLVPQADTTPHAEHASTSATDAFAPNPAELAALLADKATLDAALATSLPRLVVQVSPQMFGAQPVGGAIELPPARRDILVSLVDEARLVIELLEAADAIQALVAPTNDALGTSEPTSEAGRQEAVSRLARWKGRPINFMFLARVLTQRGVWQSLQGGKSSDGDTVAGLHKKVAAQAAETGATADVGSWWDADEAREELNTAPLPGAVAIDSTHAMNVFDMLAHAEPTTRASLIKQLHRMGLLDRMCKQLPWGHVKQLWESVEDPEASRLLEPYWEGKGGGKSLGKRLKEQDHWYTDALNKMMDFGTLGAKPQIDQAYEAREAGLISDDEYLGAVDNAIGRATLVMAAMAATGGLAGEVGAGAASGFGLGARGTVLTAGAAAGAVGAASGHLIGDVYDQALNGKDGFDSAGAYAESLLLGGVVGAGLSLGAAQFLPRGTRTVGQDAATAHPQMIRILEAARNAGVGAAVRVRMTVREFIDSIGGGGGAPPGLRLAYAHGGGGLPPRIASAPPESGVWVTVRPLQDLNVSRPMQSSRSDGDDLLEIQSVEQEGERLFDGYGKDASYADDAADWRADTETRPMAEEPIEDIGVAEPEQGGSLSSRRVRHVPDRRMSPEMEAEHGMSVLDEARLDITRSPRHHTLPQEEIEFFQARGFPGRDIDNFTVEIDKLDHEMVHGGNQSLARRHWQQREWSTKLMKTLRGRETALGRQLNRNEILSIVQEQRIEFDIAEAPFVHYHEAAQP